MITPREVIAKVLSEQADTRPLPLRLGKLYCTPGAWQAMTEAGVSGAKLLGRHMLGDWGDCCPEDWRANDEALTPGEEERVFSVYEIAPGEKVWIITEWDRSMTTVLLPSEY